MRLRRVRIIKRISIALLAIVCVSVNAQYSVAEINVIKLKNKNDKIIQLNNELVYDIELVKGKPLITVHTNEAFLYLKDISIIGVNRSIFSSEIMPLIDHEALLFNVVKGKYKKKVITNSKEITNDQSYSFYDDKKEYLIEFNPINEGAIVVLKRKHIIKDPHFLPKSYLQSYMPIENQEIKFVVDNAIKIDFVLKNFVPGFYKYTEHEHKKNTIYTWKANNIEPFEIERNMPSMAYFAPHIIPVINSYLADGKEVPVLRDLNDLYTWYYRFIEEAITGIDDTELQLLADSLTRNCTTELEKVERIYYWVQSNIKYIAFEYGMGGFIPRKPDDILHKRYGDCKDKSCILYYMLKLAGVESHFTWIGTTDIPYKYNEVYTPSADNHMIITYIDGDNYYFLDGTSKNLPINVPSSFTQGKEALIAIDKEKFKVKKVPIVEYFENKASHSIKIKINQNRIVGKGIASLKGYPFYYFNNRYKNFDYNDRKDWVKSYVEIGNNKFVLGDYSIKDVHDFELNGIIDYDFRIGDYLKRADDEIYLNMNMDRSISNYRIDKDRENPLFFENSNSYELMIELEIPNGYKIDYIPENTEFKTPEFGFAIKYKEIGKKIIYEYEHYQNVRLVEKENLPDWNDYIKQIENAHKETVLLKQVQK